MWVRRWAPFIIIRKVNLWSLMANDFKWSAEKVLEHLTKSVRSGDVVLFHDSQKAESVVLLEVLPEFIEHCKSRGLGISDCGLLRQRNDSAVNYG